MPADDRPMSKYKTRVSFSIPAFFTGVAGVAGVTRVARVAWVA